MVKKKNIDAYFQYAYSQVEKVKADLNSSAVELQKSLKQAIAAENPIQGPEEHEKTINDIKYQIEIINNQIRQANQHYKFLKYNQDNFIQSGKEYVLMIDTDKPSDFQERCLNIIRTINIMEHIKLYKRKPQPAPAAPIQPEA